jgi:hypothetical protein
MLMVSMVMTIWMVFVMMINLPFCLSEDDRLKIILNKPFGIILLNKDPQHIDRRTFYISEINWAFSDTIVFANYGTGLMSRGGEPAIRTEFIRNEIYFVN